jgi:hypothetical protein
LSVEFLKNNNHTGKETTTNCFEVPSILSSAPFLLPYRDFFYFIFFFNSNLCCKILSRERPPSPLYEKAKKRQEKLSRM